MSSEPLVLASLLTPDMREDLSHEKSVVDKPWPLAKSCRTASMASSSAFENAPLFMPL